MSMEEYGSVMVTMEKSLSFKKHETEKEIIFENSISFKKHHEERNDISYKDNNLTVEKTQLLEFSSPRPLHELDAAAVKLQKVYKSYRTRRNLADCAVIVEELWWKALDSASLELSSVSFFGVEKHESAISRWSRAQKRAAKVGKGLSHDEKAQKLALQHWLEAIDPRHRYGHNLHLYYEVWFESKNTEPFFYWLDVGEGREVKLGNCPRSKLQKECIKYLGPKEREEYEVIVADGKLVYKQHQIPVNTVEGSKLIFVLSTSRSLYVGKKIKGLFQHSSFLSGAATTAAGRMVVNEGILKAIWPYSGHYLPTEENFTEFISFLQDNNVDLSTVKRVSVDDDKYPSFKKTSEHEIAKLVEQAIKASTPKAKEEATTEPLSSPNATYNSKFEHEKRLSCKWSSGTGPRIGCVHDYPLDIRSKALEQVRISPRFGSLSGSENKLPIPSPRPSPKVRLSPRLTYMRFPTPNVSLTLPNSKFGR